MPDLTRALIDIPSPSRQEDAIATAVHAALESTVAAFTGPARTALRCERDHGSMGGKAS